MGAEGDLQSNKFLPFGKARMGLSGWVGPLWIPVYRSICLRGGDVSQHRLPVAGLRVESVLS